MNCKLLFISAFLILFLVGSAAAFSNSGGEEWKYSKDIMIKENSGTPLTDYQILVNLDSNNFDFTSAKYDGSDIRFEDTQGNELNYWIETWENSNKNARIWVKIPNISARGETKIKIYYGNEKAGGFSNGDATFDFFDDFKGSILNPLKWNENSVNRIQYTMNNNFRFKDATKSGNSYWIYTGINKGSQNQAKWTPTNNFIIDWESTISGQTASQMGEGGIGVVGSNNELIYYLNFADWCAAIYHAFISVISPTGAVYKQDLVGSSTCTGNSAPVQISKQFTIIKNGNIYTALIDGRTVNTYTSNLPVKSIALTAGAYGGYSFLDYIEIKNVKIRKYASNEPGIFLTSLNQQGKPSDSTGPAIIEQFSPSSSESPLSGFNFLLALVGIIGFVTCAGIIVVVKKKDSRKIPRNVAAIPDPVPSLPSPQQIQIQPVQPSPPPSPQLSAKPRPQVNHVMDDLPRRKLKEIIAQYGSGIVNEPVKVKGLLLDYCATSTPVAGSNYQKEIHLLTLALTQNIPQDLLTISQNEPFEFKRTRLQKRLTDLAVEETAARWAVEAWAEALGMMSEAK